jgi:hypothetical protein
MRLPPILFSLLLVSTVVAAPDNVSELWGRNGERWTPQSRLPDFSFAGYRYGDRPIPDAPALTSVTDFGAVGDGRADDTAAFQRALREAPAGVLAVPAGRFRLTGLVRVRRPNLVLRGAGESKTVLFFDTSFERLRGPGKVPYTAGLLSIEGEQTGERLTAVMAGARRGDTRLRVTSAEKISPGDAIRLVMFNPSDNSLGRHLFGEQGGLNEERRKWQAGRIVDWMVRVTSVDGDELSLERPLRIDVRPEWKPEILRHLATVEESGIEDLSVEFPGVEYRGHHNEEGYFAIQLARAFHCWVRRVTVVDADLGVVFHGGGHNTVANVTLAARRRSREAETAGGGLGHYGIATHGFAQDNLVQDCDLQVKFVHNLSCANFSSGNVYSRIRTKFGRLDQHGGAPYENLYTQIVVTEHAADLFYSGGNRRDEPNAGARLTLWNVCAERGDFPAQFPRLADGNPRLPLAIAVGIDRWETRRTADTEWIERWPGETTVPANLHEAQLAVRRSRSGATQ